MAQHASAIRQHRRSLRRQAVKKQNKSALRTQVRKVRALVQAKDADSAKKLLPEVFSAIDRSVKKGAIHANKGARYKSRISRQVAAINTAPSK
jgi:small subunit ribosomal protein S20